ncbi:MAG: M23 family metallopeptidase [Mongoliibacter sp.]|uniref:M23 family metallopeptidase n=1 Tax=Mongoliibacter sp. TaxID=2022438 RepID=UPI0012EFE39A|nr:M23 family metallopeptidase [Mongoliibacter sp.]TVP53607.1 MAG: M23 family metallopeptidase [Mongoliibacter sp.]
MKSNKFPLLLFLFLSLNLQAQDYLFPVKPGQRALLAGNFSEIRPNHFHSGIDVKIGGVDGEPILSITDGYVYRMKVSSYGYGNVLYIRHNDGQSSVYAHLRNFSPKIMDFMRERMYAEKKNDLEVFLEPQEIPVKKGEIIGNGGNTGSSGGPHLHFEIRDTLDHAIDPFKYRWKEIVDTTSPILYRMALTPLDFLSRVDGEFARKEFTPLIESGKYLLPQDVKISGRVGLEIYAIDKMDGVGNTFGIPVFELSEDDNPLFRIHIDHIDFYKSRYLLSHAHQNRFTRVYHYPNNQMELYDPKSSGSGALTALPGESKKINLAMKDYFGNTRMLSFQIIGEKEEKSSPSPRTVSHQPTVITYHREVMKIQAGSSEWGEMAQVHVHGYIMDLPPAYLQNGRRIYLWDMNYGVPEKIDICTETIFPTVQKKIPFGEEMAYFNNDVGIHFEEKTLLDDLFLRIEKSRNGRSKAIKINAPQEYLQSNMEVLFKNTGFEGDKTHAHVYFQSENGWKSFVGGTWESEDIRFKTRNFGTFVIEEDKVPPAIRAVRVNSSELRFIIRDNKSGIRDFEAFVDGEWVLMRYEHKQNVIWSEKINKQPFKGEVLLKVRDMAGNESQYTSTLN